MSQDFTKRIAIVVREDLPSWQVLNTVAHIAGYLGNKIGDTFLSDEFFSTKDGTLYPRNSQYPIIILSAKENQIGEFMRSVDESGLLYHAFLREMIETTDDTEITTILAQKTRDELEYLGIGVFGTHEEVKTLTKRFNLWKGEKKT